jgi:outer membrane lipoprotein-sorting protein
MNIHLRATVKFTNGNVQVDFMRSSGKSLIIAMAIMKAKKQGMTIYKNEISQVKIIKHNFMIRVTSKNGAEKYIKELGSDYSVKYTKSKDNALVIKPKNTDKALMSIIFVKSKIDIIDCGTEPKDSKRILHNFNHNQPNTTMH